MLAIAIISILSGIFGILLALLFPFVNGAGQSWPEANPDHTIAAPSSSLYRATFHYPVIVDSFGEHIYPEDMESFMDDTFPLYQADTLPAADDFECAKGTGTTFHATIVEPLNGLPCVISDADIDDFFSEAEYQRDREVALRYGFDIGAH